MFWLEEEDGEPVKLFEAIGWSGIAMITVGILVWVVFLIWIATLIFG